MKALGARSIVLVMGTALLMTAMLAPASAAKRVGAPWVVAASPTSVTLDWSGSGSFRVYSSREGGGSKHSVKTSTSRRKVTGLRPGTMYCFQVARSNGSGRSQTYCHSTMTRKNASSATPISVVTFNVCAHARNCGHWSGREAAVVKQILAADADVVAVQEAGTKIRRLHELLQPYGYEIPNYKYMSEDDAIFYRPAKLTVVPRPLDTCENCEGFPNANTIAAGRGASGVWANLRATATGKEYTFVSLHLQNGTSAKVSRLRKQQLRRIMTWMTTKVPADDPIIYAGDFNSSRMRADDSPRKALATTGYVDTFERASTYSKSYVNTYNGYDARPRRGIRYGDHIDRVFVQGTIGASSWAVVAPLRRGRNVRPMASDHYPVRVTLWLP